MKNLILYLIVLISVILLSCQKEVIYPSNELPAEVPTNNNFVGVNRWGEFTLIGSKKMVTNTATGNRVYYDDFANKSRSSLRWGGSLFAIEEIIKDTTIWSFWEPNGGSDGKFVLNNDTTHYYMVHYSDSYTTIIEDPTHGQQNMGGSARPISGKTLDKSNNTIQIYVQTGYFTDAQGDACEYYTELTFKKTKEW